VSGRGAPTRPPRHGRGTSRWHTSAASTIPLVPRPSPRQRHIPVAHVSRVHDPVGTATIAPSEDCRPSGPAGQAPPDPYRTGPTPHRRTHVPDRGCVAPPCRGEALPRPPAPPARQFNVADTSRPTRSADQPNGRIDDRPAVNGRAQSPSRLKPADPNGPCTQPIDPGAWAPSCPLQGACGLSPGLQPRAFAADRPGSDGRGTAAPFGVDLPALAGRTGQAAPDPYQGGEVAPPWRPYARPGMGWPTL
jgi:hypothetical protein